MATKSIETFKCAACGKREDKNKMHIISVHQKNRPIKNPDKMFDVNTDVQICEKCYKFYGRR